MVIDCWQTKCSPCYLFIYVSPLVIEPVWLTWSEIRQVPLPISVMFQEPFARISAQLELQIQKLIVKYNTGSSLRQRRMFGRSRGWRDTQVWPLVLLLAEKRVCGIQFWAGWPVELVCCYFTCTPKMWRLKLCIYLNSTVVSNCHWGWFVSAS